MATFDSAWCLQELNNLCSRPSVDEVPDTTKYRYLAVAQQNVIGDLASRTPWAFYGAPVACVTTDNKVFTFGTDANGYPLFPLGKVKIFTSLASVPDSPLREGVDYLDEGTQVRIPNDGTYAGPLYWRGLIPPADIASATQPVLYPKAARMLIVLDAAIRFQRDNSQQYQGLQLDYARDFAKWCLVYKTQFASGGALSLGVGVRDSVQDSTIATVVVS